MIDKRLMRESRQVARYLAATISLGIGMALLAVAQAWIFSGIVAKVFLAGAQLRQVRNPLLWLLSIFVLRAFAQWLSETASHEAALRVKETLRERFLAKLLMLGPIYTRGERAGELVSTAIEGIEALEDYFARYIPQLALAGFLPLVFLLFAFPLDWESGLILLITGPLIPVFMILIGKLAEKKSLEQWKALSWMSAHFLDVLQGLTTLKLFGRSRDQSRVISRVSDSYRKATLRVLKIAFLSAFVLEFLATISTALVAVALGLRLVYGKISFQEALFLLLLAPEFYLPLRTLGLQFHAGLSGVSAANRIYEVLNHDFESMDTDFGDPLSEVLRDGLKTEIVKADLSLLGSGCLAFVFDRVSLVYEENSAPALHDLCFEVQAGEKVAFVGPSGAGKSSVFSLIMRFIEPTKGQIFISAGQPARSISLAQIPAAEWRSHVAYVSQNPYLFAGTIEDNIRLGKPNASEAEVIEAAQKAAAHEFIRELPQGYQTLVGEGGTGLSGGQAQRIALARAFLKDAPLLLLDEATEGLDAVSEEAIQRSLAELMKGRTVLMIAHRLHTVVQADRIFVLDQGRIAEAGTHQELLKRNGIYAHLVQQYRGEDR